MAQLLWGPQVRIVEPHASRVWFRVVLLAALPSGAPSIALGWKDRVTKPESEGGGNGKENRPFR